MSPKILLIHPPVAKPSEPPAGIARLSAVLKANGILHQLIDANLEGMLDLLHTTVKSGVRQNRWDDRACRRMTTNLTAIQSTETFGSPPRYSRAVRDISHILSMAGKPYGVHLSLADYADLRHSPVSSTQLIKAAEVPEANPFYPYFSERLERALGENPEFIGFSLNFLSQALCTMAMIGYIRKIQPRQKIILGGSLTTSWVQISGRSDLFSGLVDEVVAGAGEERLLDILGVPNPLSGASTDYSLLGENRYLSPGFILPFSAARGCWWRKCSFCPETTEANPYLALPPSDVIEELSTLCGQTRPSLIHLLDSSIAPSLLKALARQPAGAPWYGFARVTEHLTDEGFCRMLKKSGCAMLKLGIESGDQAVLDHLNKGIDLQTASAALYALKQAGIAVYAYFLFGTPPENEAGARKTLDFVCRHSDCIDFLNLAVFNLPATSVAAENLVTDDFYEGDMSLYKSFQHPEGWHRPRVRDFLDKIFKRHPAVAPIIRRTPEFFTSNHAAFFV